eukprot:Gregarina_sp_Poly_1__5389@NODE_2847_length_1638_cov_6_021006_g1796_i0_p1_GENE_NODE_2847_length_1638_cov_6_021006_g1796_i0NODE_2847_length_1638_cov_6_021006_g1796_i0_p1_ORF_typecomplete_len171_score32_48_NODE_2847_length_1638_cov_6_021006_g1796_i0391903
MSNREKFELIASRNKMERYKELLQKLMKLQDEILQESRINCEQRLSQSDGKLQEVVVEQFPEVPFECKQQPSEELQAAEIDCEPQLSHQVEELQEVRYDCEQPQNEELKAIINNEPLWKQQDEELQENIIGYEQLLRLKTTILESSTHDCYWRGKNHESNMERCYAEKYA